MHILTCAVPNGARLRRLVLPLIIAIAATPGEGLAQNSAKPTIRNSIPLMFAIALAPGEGLAWNSAKPVIRNRLPLMNAIAAAPGKGLTRNSAKSAIGNSAPLSIAIATAPSEGLAQNSAKPAIRNSAPLSIEVDKAQLIQLPESAKTVFVANPEIADVQVPTPTSFLIYGKKAGATTVFAISESGATSSYTVRVSRPISELAAAVHDAVPSAQVKISAALDGVTITGSVDSPRNAERLKAAARQYLGEKETINFDVAVSAATQVTLRVRVAEVSRNIDKQLGVNWQGLFNNGTLAVGLLTGRTAVSSFGNFVPATSSETFGSVGLGYSANGGKVNISTLVDALDQSGLATILAEPSLTAVSGETANFLAGGEYPIPVPQGNQVVTIDYKRYGISVDFTPTVLDGNRISIKVRPEVSALTTVGQLTLDNISVPALTVRRAETTVELGSGESFAIAGLFQNDASNQIKQLPWLGDVPILGALFRSTSFQRNESELVIIVTPYIVKPVSRSADLQSPTEALRYSSDIERILLGRLSAADMRSSAPPTKPANEPHLHGASGFMLE
jgi:pilus assembly protein CpaC